MTELKMPLDKWFELKVAKFTDRVHDVADEVAGEGQEFVWNAIETRGTGRTWKRVYTRRGIQRSASRPGREWTGDMKEDVETKVSALPGAIISSYGWIENYEEYYGLQEGGFTQADTGIEIEGMFAMADAADMTFKSVKDKMRRVVREF